MMAVPGSAIQNPCHTPAGISATGADELISERLAMLPFASNLNSSPLPCSNTSIFHCSGWQWGTDIGSRLRQDDQALHLLTVTAMQQQMKPPALAATGLTRHLGKGRAADDVEFVRIC
jgi:hypothetical protein